MPPTAIGGVPGGSGGVHFFKKPNRLRDWLIINLGSAVFKAWFATCRVKVIGEEVYNRYGLRHGAVVAATWHRNVIFLIWFFRKVNIMAMISRSADGELLAGFATKVGLLPVRGSSSRGGRTALQKMLAFLRHPAPGEQATIAATVLDGPQGPRFVAKKGMIVLAMQSGAPFVPVAASCHPAITLTKAWDKTQIPLPFSRVTVILREPWVVPPDLNEAGLEILRQEVEDALNEMTREADADVGYREPG